MLKQLSVMKNALPVLFFCMFLFVSAIWPKGYKLMPCTDIDIGYKMEGLLKNND